jgi:pyruvate/2-oxoglutarate dehydrogenase complex dihydrolipoamide dehydrogenase (E3) component
MENYDVLVLGSGEAGKYLAWTLASSGLRTALVERQYVGGSCPNIACLPSKNFVHSAKVAALFGRAEEFGIEATWRLDMAGVRARKRKMVDGLVQMHQDRFRASGTELIMGEGSLVGERTLQVGDRILRADKLILSTGSRATLPDVAGLIESNPLTHIGALELDVVPQHLLVLGGGYIGLELAQAMRRFGSRVTIIERNDRLAHREDPDVSEALAQLCHDEGIEVVLNATVAEVRGRSGESVTVDRVTGSHLLVATGRTPNTDGIGLELAGVERTARGFIKVNERLETTAPGTWAVGDCAGSPQFTHIAFDDYRIVRDNLVGGNRVTTGRQVPFCMFTDPEFARVGLSETEAMRAGIAYRLGRIPMTAVLRTRTLSETRGFMKALVGTDDRILGFTAFGVDVGELLAPVQLVMSAGLPYTALRDAVLTHPTISEGLTSLFASVP